MPELKLINQNKKANQNLEGMLDGGCESLDIDNSLEHYQTTLADYLKKIAYGGSIKLAGTDIGLVASSIINKQLSQEQIEKLLYNGRVRVFSVFDIIDQLKQAGFVIQKSILANYQYSIIAERPV